MLLLAGLSFSLHLAGQVKNPALKITRLTGDFYVFTTYRNYKGAATSSNGMYFLSEKGAVLIDTPWDTTQFQPLLDSIRIKHKQKVVFCIATHSHEDRTGGLEFLKKQGVKTYTSMQTDSICAKSGDKRAGFFFKKDTTFTIGEHIFQTCYAGPGHTKDNIAIWFGKEKILYGGCLIKSTEAEDLGYIAEANLKDWPTTLNTLKLKFKDPNYIIPGHQGWKSLKSIDHTLNLLLKHN